MQEQIDLIVETALDELSALDEVGLDDWRRKFTGRSSQLNSILRAIGTLSAEERPAVGQAANAAQGQLEKALRDRQEILRNLSQENVEAIDITLPGYQPNIGGLHPITQTLREIRRVFSSIGFRAVDSPEVEWDEYNFEKLNIPRDHPARDMWDTFYVEHATRPGEMLLRTHTSPAQARVMERTTPPIRIITPGRCYRYEDVDTSHESTFFQVEGLAVDTNITMANLRGTLEYFARTIFGPERKIRIRGSFFPFTEPSCEAEMSCHVCNGDGCRVCGGTGWIEMLGAGMVHPNVLEGVGYDHRKYSGFAFGMGVERIAMLKYRIDDIRHFYRNDLRFLRQFS